MDGCYSFYKDLGEGYVIPVLQSDPMVLNIEWIERVLRQKYWSVFKPQSLNKNVINIVDLALFQLFFLGQVYLKKRTELNVNFRKTFNALASLSRVTQIISIINFQLFHYNKFL